MFTSQNGAPEGGGRCLDPLERLRQLYDADARGVDPQLALLARVFNAGELPASMVEAQVFNVLVYGSRVWLECKPTPKTISAAGFRLQRAISEAARHIAAERRRAAA